MLEIRGLSLSFDNRFILRKLYCNFPNAEIIVLTGENGSGKTSLLEVMAGLREADEGEVLLDGRIYPQKNEVLGSGIGIVFQRPEAQIIELTVEDDILFGLKNIKLSPEERTQRLEEALQWSGLTAHRHQYPHILSGGQLRRLALAAVIAMGARYILLDEPFENLDYSGVRETLHQILLLRERSCTVVIVTHDLDKCLAHTDRIIVLREGEIRLNTHPRESLKELSGLGVRCPPMALPDMTWY